MSREHQAKGNTVIPVCVQNGSSMPSKQGNLIRQLALLTERNHSESAAAASLPIDREVFSVRLHPASASHQNQRTSHRAERLSRRPKTQGKYPHLDQIGIPSIPTNAQVIVAKFLPRRLAEDVSYGPRQTYVSTGQSLRVRLGGTGTPGRDSRYFDARTKRPAMWGGSFLRITDQEIINAE
jgi:hypothetical protein